MRRLLVATVLLGALGLSAAPASAREPTIPRPPLPPHYVIHQGACPRVLPVTPGPTATVDDAGCAYMAGPMLGHIWMTYAPRNDPQIREHELGHVYDAEVLTPGNRNRIIHVQGRHTAWDIEHFANLYAQCRLGSAAPVAVIVNAAKLRRVCGVISRAGTRAGLH